MFVAVCVGAVHIAPMRIADVLLRGSRDEADWESLVILRVRLPRAIVAYLVGGALATSGGAMQGVFRNPLADPGVLGVSNAAALGAVIAIFSGLGARTAAALPLAACAGALATTAALVFLAGRGGRFRVGTLLLAGIALSNLAVAATTLLISMALANYDVGRQIVLWLMGGLEGRTWSHVAMGFAPILAGAAVLMGNARSLDALLLGDVAAEAVGVQGARVRLRLVVATAVLTGVSVAIAGAIGFVGLLAPHVARRLVGATHVKLLPACFLGGGLFLVVADSVRRGQSSRPKRFGSASSRRRSGPRSSSGCSPSASRGGRRERAPGRKRPLRGVWRCGRVARREHRGSRRRARRARGPQRERQEHPPARPPGGTARELGARDLDGAPLASLDARLRARTLTMVVHGTPTDFAISVRELVALGRIPYEGRLGGTTRADARAVEDALASTDTSSLSARTIETLSAGELQRVHLARVFAQGAPVVLLDEPTANLDPRHQLEAIALLRAFVFRGGAALIALHNLSLAARGCDRIVVLEHGCVRADGVPPRCSPKSSSRRCSR